MFVYIVEDKQHGGLEVKLAVCIMISKIEGTERIKNGFGWDGEEHNSSGKF